MIDKIKHILDSTAQMFINLCSAHRKNNCSNLLKKADVEIKPPNGCSERTMKSPKMNKTITILGIIHTEDSKNEQLNEEVNFWIESKISDADQNTTVLLEMNQEQLDDKRQWDKREMFVAARQAASKNFPIEATEPGQAIRELLLSESYISQWTSFNSKTIPQEDHNPLIDAYIRNVQIIHRRLANNETALKPEHKETILKYVPNFENRLNWNPERKGVYLYAPEKWVLENNKTPCIFNRISTVSMQIRDENVIKKIKSTTTSNVIIVCGEYHVNTIAKQIEDS